MVTDPFSAMEKSPGFSYVVGFVLCLKGDLNMFLTVAWIVALQNSEYHSRPLVEQNETVKVKVLNEKLSLSLFFKISV